MRRRKREAVESRSRLPAGLLRRFGVSPLDSRLRGNDGPLEELEFASVVFTVTTRPAGCGNADEFGQRVVAGAKETRYGEREQETFWGGSTG
jgi:hypothetical protein